MVGTCYGRQNSGITVPTPTPYRLSGSTHNGHRPEAGRRRRGRRELLRLHRGRRHRCDGGRRPLMRPRRRLRGWRENSTAEGGDDLAQRLSGARIFRNLRIMLIIIAATVKNAGATSKSNQPYCCVYVEKTGDVYRYIHCV